ncbi:MAG: hypothetical protein ACTHPS_10040 [Streptosporangiaceae bacterium]
MGPAEQRGNASTRPCGRIAEQSDTHTQGGQAPGKGDLITCHGGARNAARRVLGWALALLYAMEERRFTLIDRHRFHGILVTLWLRR